MFGKLLCIWDHKSEHRLSYGKIFLLCILSLDTGGGEINANTMDILPFLSCTSKHLNAKISHLLKPILLLAAVCYYSTTPMAIAREFVQSR